MHQRAEVATHLGRAAVGRILPREIFKRLTRLHARWSTAQERYVELVIENRQGERTLPFGVEPEREGALERSVAAWPLTAPFHRSHHFRYPGVWAMNATDVSRNVAN